jgi:hypothetical protein
VNQISEAKETNADKQSIECTAAFISAPSEFAARGAMEIEA